MELNFLAIVMRWLHMLAACGMVGSVFYYLWILPMGLRDLDEAARLQLLRRPQRGFKMTVHATFLLFLISGTYNAMRNWVIYTYQPGLMHGLFGMHLLLGIGGVAGLMVMLAGREPRPGRNGWTRWALILLVLAIGAGSTLKSAREWTMTHGAPTASAARPAK